MVVAADSAGRGNGDGKSLEVSMPEPEPEPKGKLGLHSCALRLLLGAMIMFVIGGASDSPLTPRTPLNCRDGLELLATSHKQDQKVATKSGKGVGPSLPLDSVSLHCATLHSLSSRSFPGTISSYSILFRSIDHAPRADSGMATGHSLRSTIHM